ncbi:LysR family transcriptional regulator [Mycobacteroides abscessus subsp. abscessus]|nr:LysR family transcriptional regulator [Mycobacteroides abscessus subsp. abscessus]
MPNGPPNPWSESNSPSLRQNQGGSVRFRFKDFQIVEDMVAHGHGVALMPRYASRSPRVARVVIREVRAARLYEVLARPGARHRPAIAATIQGLRDAAAVLESR